MLFFIALSLCIVLRLCPAHLVAVSFCDVAFSWFWFIQIRRCLWVVFSSRFPCVFCPLITPFSRLCRVFMLCTCLFGRVITVPFRFGFVRLRRNSRPVSPCPVYLRLRLAFVRAARLPSIFRLAFILCVMECFVSFVAFLHSCWCLSSGRENPWWTFRRDKTALSENWGRKTQTLAINLCCFPLRALCELSFCFV